MAQPEEAISDGFEDIDGPIPVLDICGVDQDEYQKAAGVGGLDAPTVDDARTGRSLAGGLLGCRHHQQVVDRRQQAAVPPVVQIAAHCQNRRKGFGRAAPVISVSCQVLRRYSPKAARARRRCQDRC
jgi:hypothetical protein